MIGDMLGPYRVLDKLGEGGMGQVYPSSGLATCRASDWHWRARSTPLSPALSGAGICLGHSPQSAWIAALGSAAWDLAPDGKRVVALIPEATAQAPQQEHGIVMLLNFADELRRRVPLGKSQSNGS